MYPIDYYFLLLLRFLPNPPARATYRERGYGKKGQPQFITPKNEDIFCSDFCVKGCLVYCENVTLERNCIFCQQKFKNV